ncbi:MAG TPA: NAD-dependent epimerase/dehydratase family protein [Solirubrobacterales bacterium]|nr:NAD-dependent epimerase/dehydratase family protein [Solirubrobacterales bacterium]
MARALVTGAAGFVGSHLCERLLADGYEVIGLDSFSDHYARELKQLNIAALAGEPRFRLVERDLSSDSIGDLFEGADVAFHLAARPGVRDSWVEFDDYVAANIVGSRLVFDAAAKAGVRVVYASSSSVYGDAASLPVGEQHPVNPISPYGASKVMTEVLAGAYASSFGLDAIGMRYFTVYGPRQRPDMGLSRFIEAATAGEAISVYGDGLQRRDMTYVGDVVEATVLAAELGRSGAVYNVASDSPRTLLDILDGLAEALDLPVKLAHEEAKPGDVRDTWGDIGRAVADLGYEPKVPLQTGLERQVEEAGRRRAALEEPQRARSA